MEVIEEYQLFLKPLYEVEGLSSFQFSLPISLSPNLLALFQPCDWSIGYIARALIGQKKGYSQTTHGFVQSKSPAGLSVYKCTEAGLNSCITVPSKVCAPEVSTKKIE
jgi:hypothetical protein